MDVFSALCAFENKYKFLYDIQVGGVAIYTCLRDGMMSVLSDQGLGVQASTSTEKGRVYPKRVLDSLMKWRKYRNRKTLIFTSAVYRRDKGRNLAVEFLMDKYPDAVAFEWPSRNTSFDSAYFHDKKNYVPIDGYLILYKLYSFLHRKERSNIEAQCRSRLEEQFAADPPQTDVEKRAVAFILEQLPQSVSATEFSQRLFKWMFRKYKNVDYAIDFWGSGRENIIPVLPGNPQSIELQHGIITPSHQGYVYPEFVRNSSSCLFSRKILVYGEKEKEILSQNSIFPSEMVEVIGNPRIYMYKVLFKEEKKNKKWILFTSQPYEQSYPGTVYYNVMLPYLQRIANYMEQNTSYKLAVKLHPRENNAVKKLYEDKLPKTPVFGAESELYDLLCESYIHITVSSTVLLEGAAFDVPTVTLQFQKSPETIFGIKTLHIESPDAVESVCEKLTDETFVESYLEEIKRHIERK